jgi:polyferredoxin
LAALVAFFGAAFFGAAFFTTFFGAAFFGAAFLATFLEAFFTGAVMRKEYQLVNVHKKILNLRSQILDIR